MKTHKSLFHIRKSSWAIIIEIIGHVEKDEDRIGDSNIITINENLYLDLSKYHKMLVEYKMLLKNGLLWIADNIPDDQLQIIVIDELGINPSDFQNEGFFFGIAQWASTYYDFRLPDFEWGYNSDERKYFFSSDHNELMYLLYPS